MQLVVHTMQCERAIIHAIWCAPSSRLPLKHHERQKGKLMYQFNFARPGFPHFAKGIKRFLFVVDLMDVLQVSPVPLLEYRGWSIKWYGRGADLIFSTKAWRSYHQCRQNSLLSYLVIQIPAAIAIGIPAVFFIIWVCWEGRFMLFCSFEIRSRIDDVARSPYFYQFPCLKGARPL